MPLIVLLAASLALSGCGIFAASGPPPTPDPFAGLSGKSDELLSKGLQLMDKGDLREALTTLEQARLYSPQPDPRIEQAIERVRAAMNPTATPTVTPTPTITPTPRPPVRMSTQQPDEALAEAYFGTTYLTVVPGQPLLLPPMTLFWAESQIGLYIQRLGMTLRQPLMLRVFDLTTGQLVGEASTDMPASEPAARPPSVAFATPTATLSAEQALLGGMLSGAGAVAASAPAATAPVAAAPVGSTGTIKKWFDAFVWYRDGGERPGKYRLELYAGAQLARVLDYEVQQNFVPLPTATATPTATPTETPTPTGTVPIPGAPGAAPGTPGTPGPAFTPTPLPTPTPTPGVARVAVTGGLPAGVTYNPAISSLYVADASGVVWLVDDNGPVLKRPFVLDASPVDMVVDPLTGRLYVALKGNGSQTTIAILHGTSGERLGSITIPNGQVTDLAINPGAGLLYALVPSREQLSIVDLRQNAAARAIKYGPLSQVTGMTLDPSGNRLFMSVLTGQLLIFDAREPGTGQQIGISGTGLAGVAALDDKVFVFNTPGRKVYVVNPTDQRIEREIVLEQEPGAIAAGSGSGMVYVLGTQRPAILRLHPGTGEVTGTAFLPDRSGRMNIQPGASRDLGGLQNRIVVNQYDESLYVTQPEIGTVSVVTVDMFPALRSAGR